MSHSESGYDSEDPGGFKLKASKAFEDRGKSVFGCLPDVTLRHDEVPPIICAGSNFVIDDDLIGMGKPKTSRKRNYNAPTEFAFKRPCIPCPRGRRSSVPDYRRNPQKWTKYSVADVDTSDKANTSAALSFLQEMDSRKAGKQHDNEEICTKVTFKKPKRVELTPIEVLPLTPTLESTRKHVMAAFEFGKKKESEKKKKDGSKAKAQKGRELKLSHLADEDE